MSTRPNRLLLGLIILAVGVISLINPTITFNFATLTLLAVGAAFLLLYRTKRKTWSLAVGVYLVYFGVASVVQPYTGVYFSLSLLGAMFFIVPGVIFLVLYFDKNKRGLLLPACMMLWFGIFTFLKGFYTFEGYSSGLFFICAGAGFAMVYILGRHLYGRWVLYGAGVMGLLGLISLFGGRTSMMLAGLPKLASVAIIAVSAVIIYRALRNR